MTNEHHECCLRCQGRRVVIGKFTQREGFLYAPSFRCFRPSGFWSKLAYRMGLAGNILIPVSGESFLCLDCGTTWTTIDPKTAESLIRDGAAEPLKRSLGLVEKIKTPADELA